MLTDKEIKKQMQPLFEKNYEKYYPTDSLKQMGFERKKCTCGNHYWSYGGAQMYCGDPMCVGGYSFIGKTLTTKKHTYMSTWKSFANHFAKYGYKEIKRYPVTARWYEELEFTTASINAFQPNVVSGASEPPENPLVIPQFCLRFPDVDNVGISGRHATGFIMMGQHAFNNPEKYVYFKKEAIQQIYEYITNSIGVKKKGLTFIEDIWAGGGNFGPSLEFFSGGLELGNQVYMQYKIKPDGTWKELNTKIIDMGQGLERVPWFTQGTPTVYDTTFPYVLKKLYEITGIKPDKKFWTRFSPYAGTLNVDEVENMDKAWEEIAKKMKTSVQELRQKIGPISALYAIADHTRSLLVAINDGALPSNVGGGYNLRNILRRCFAFNRQYKFGIDIAEVMEWHKKDELGKLFPELKNTKIQDIIKTEKERYLKTTLKGRKEIKKLLYNKKTIDTNTLLKLYDSKGISPEIVKEIAKEKNQDVNVPANFYYQISEMHLKKGFKKIERKYDTERLVPTIKLYYEKENERTFTAKVKKIIGNHIVLNQTLFYPTSGGQDHDTGTINNYEVEEVEMQDGVIFHKLKKHDLKEGDEIQGKINWERRQTLSKYHTATHVVYAACRKVLGEHVYQSGAEKKIGKARLDITHYKALSFKELQNIELMANRLVAKQIIVSKTFMSRKDAEKKYGMRIYQGGAVPGKEIRIVEIKGIDAQACGGTHTNNTGEIGLIKIINTERIQDGVVRVEYKVGEQALKSMHEKDEIIHELRDLWGVQQDRIIGTAEKFFDEWKQRGRKINELEEEIIKSHIKRIITSSPKFVGIKTRLTNLGIIQKEFQENKEKIKEKAIIIFANNFAVGYSTNPEININVELSKHYKIIKEKNGIYTAFQKK
ncbi:MAG: alanine--tRNA ligase [Nanoarchaeota archaeon]|nr:alanine--tRNA ligase [Nanoarchaeota archaeon]